MKLGSVNESQTSRVIYIETNKRLNGYDASKT
jgi:hypothetical protein